MTLRTVVLLAVALAAALPFAAADDGPTVLDSGPLYQGDAYSFVFEQEGTFSYLCRPHPYMKAVVVVRAGEPVHDVNATIGGYAFQPVTLHVGPGANVTWTNQDDVVHTVSSISHVLAGEFEWWMVMVPVGALFAAASLFFLWRRSTR